MFQMKVCMVRTNYSLFLGIHGSQIIALIIAWLDFIADMNTLSTEIQPVQRTQPTLGVAPHVISKRGPPNVVMTYLNAITEGEPWTY